MSFNFLFEVSPIKPNGDLITLRMSSAGSLSKGVYLNNHEFIPIITTRPSFDMKLATNGLLDQIAISYGSMGFNVSEVFANEEWSTYDWTGALGRIWVGNEGDAFDDYTQIFEGSVSALSREGVDASVELLGTELSLNTNLLYDAYEGTGNAEGPATLKGKLKPWASGVCLNVDPVLVDPAYWIYQVHGYGPIQDIPAVFEMGQQLANSVASVSTFSALAALDLEPGQWAKCLPLGMFRVGGQPSQKLTCDVHGAKDGGNFPTSVGAIVSHLIKVASPAASIGNLSLFNGVDWCFYTKEPALLGDVARQAVFEAGGYVFPDGEGAWQCGDFFDPKSPVILSSKRDAEPLVLSVTETTSGGPVYKVRVGYDRCWSTHNDAEISPALLEIPQNIDALAQDAADALEAAQQAAADTVIAVQRLNSMSADGVLDRAEKKYWTGEYARLVAERNQLVGEAAGFSNLDDALDALEDAFDGLDAYLGALTPAWNNLGADTPVTRSAFVTAWSGVYVARQTLQSAMAEQAAKKAEWDLIDDPNGTKPEDNATEGGTIGENIKDEEGNVIPPEDIITGEGTAKYVQYIGDLPTDEFYDKVADAEAQIEDLIETYGSTASASASAIAAQEAKDDALAAASVAGGHASVATTKADQATGAQTAAAASAVAANLTRAMLMPDRYEGAGQFFVGSSVGAPSVLADVPSNATAAGYGPVQEIIQTTETFVDFGTRGVLTPVPGRIYQVEVELERTAQTGSGGTAPSFSIQMRCMNDAYVTIGTATGGGSVAYTGAIQTAVAKFSSTGWVAGTVWLRPFVRVQNRTGYTSTVQIRRLTVTDITESELAASSANVATTKAAAASASESSAAASATLSANYSTDAKKQVITQLPSTFEQDGTYFTAGYDGAPSARPPFPTGTLGWSFETVAGVGRVCQTVSGAGTRDVAPIGVMPVLPGRKYRITARCRTLTNTRGIALYFIGLDASYVYSAPRTSVFFFTATTTWQTFTYDVDPTSLIANGCVYVRPMWRGDAGADTLQLASIKIEDVTSEKAAETQAGISTAQAVIATGASSAATTQANLSATYATTAQSNAQTLGLTPNARFQSSMDSWFAGNGGGAPPSSGAWNASYQSASGVWTNTSGAQSNLYSALIPINPNRKYKIRGRVYSNGTTGLIYIGATSHDGNGVTIGTNAGHNYINGWSGASKAAGWHDVESQVLTGEGATADIANWFRLGTKQIRLCAFLNYATVGATQVFGLDSLWLEDVTESDTAATSASVATSQAAVATAQAASAQQSATLAASIGTGFINPNSGFDDYPSATVGALPTGWSGTGTHTSYRVADPRGGYAWRMLGIAASDSYAQSAYTATQIVKQNDYLVFEGELQLNAGALTGSGILLYILSSTGTVLESVYIQCAVDKDSSNTVVGTGVVGRTYQFQKMYRVTNASAYGVQVYAMSHWSSLGSIAAANDITWFKAGVRRATNAEISAGVVLPSLEATVTSQASVIATHTSQLASRLESVSAGPSSATLKMTALNSSGGAASQIALQADEIKLGTTGGGLTINGGVATFTGKLVVGTSSGQRLTITDNLIEVYNSSGVRQIRLGIW